jgi:hypothetical protein
MQHFPVLLIFLILCPAHLLRADECPTIPPALVQEVSEQYPDHILADQLFYSREVYDGAAEKTEDNCFHVVRVTPLSYALLLRQNSTNQYTVIFAETLTHAKPAGWSICQADVFSGVLPLLRRVSTGMYLDMDTGRNFLLTRNCEAFQVVLAGSGRRYIYRCVRDGEIEKHRIE